VVFLRFFLNIGKGMGYRESVISALRVIQPISLMGVLRVLRSFNVQITTTSISKENNMRIGNINSMKMGSSSTLFTLIYPVMLQSLEFQYTNKHLRNGNIKFTN
jgi:hypothetical protein